MEKCKNNNNIPYKDINVCNMIEYNGKKNYAFVTMLILNENYAPGAIVLAQSIRKIGSLSDLIILIDNNITENTIDMLKNFYDKIIKIELQEIENKDIIQKYICNKLFALTFTEYYKVIIIDIDSLILKYPDNAFMLQPPALIYHNNKFSTRYMHIEPNLEIYNKYLKIIKNKIQLKTLEKSSKPLLEIIKILFGLKINKLDSKILEPNNNKNCYGIQYNENKPFILENKIPIEERCQWDIFKLWFVNFRNIINNNLYLKNYFCLKEVIDISKYYVASLSRFILEDYNNNLKDNLKQKLIFYNRMVKEINKLNSTEFLQYYYLDISKEYNSENINYIPLDPTFDIFLNNIKRKNIIFNLLNKKDNLEKCLKLIKNEKYKDLLISQYSRMYNSVYIILNINENININVKNTNENNNLENLIYKKNLTIEGEILQNILFNIVQKYVYSQRNIDLKRFKIEKIYNVEILFFKNIHKIENNEKNNNKDNIIFINSTNEKIRCTSIFLNKNTINNFKHKIISFDSFNKKKIFSYLYFQTIKKWLYNTYTGNSLENIIFIKKNILLDTNYYDIINLKNLIKKKISIIKIIFLQNFNKNEQNNYKNLNLDFIFHNIYNPEIYYEIEGIKFLL